ncbi:hypothetical protein C2S51_032580 [Perilla frutescens var. frutescens]|nr:hypothetical protein C2S51_032580 [Perilla frutescens var. frutescens]
MASNNNAILVFAFLFLQITAFSNSASLSTNSRWIVDDAAGNRVKLSCINWVSHLQPMIAEGLEKKPLNYIAKEIAALGFNCVRFTWPTYMFTRPDYGSLTVSNSLDIYNLSTAKAGIAQNNPQFLNMNVVELHKVVVDELGKNNLMVVLDNHVSIPGWCCGADDGNGFFGDANFNPQEWLQGLAAVARAYKANPAVVGMSMRNELRGKRQNVADWYKFMQDGANIIHRENPDFLVIVSGLSFDTNLGFLKSKPLAVNIGNKLVYEAHWYTFGIPAQKWVAQTNNLCALITKRARDNYLFLTELAGNNSFPLFLSEFGVNLRGVNEADNRYIGCLLAAVAETDIDWAYWTLQGSYILRQGKLNLEETYGVLDLNWDRPRNPAFLDRLQLVTQMNQDFKSKLPMYYKMFHPLSGQCVQISKEGIVVVANCKNASRWDQHQDGGPIKLAGSQQCLGVARDGAAARVSEDCSSNWKFVSSCGLHLGSQDDKGNYLCLERNDSDSMLLTKKCLCVGDNLVDLPTCPDNPERQWFKLVPANV